MLISVARLPEEGLRFEHQYQPGELDVTGHEFSLQQPPLIRGRVDRTGMDLRLRGQLTAAVEAPCDRCLREVSLPVEHPFELFYAPPDALAGRSGETELQPRDLAFAIYENEEINLDDLTREQLELALPTRVLCREDCRGLCPQCGADLNLEQCQCQQPLDPRWQALADLRSKG
jgi:uncharacterized protein